jgi:glycosyltransferase involved in cell wall biosynthesis
MKFSLITPEHNPNNREYLNELFECIINQTHKDWEWILYLNGSCDYSDVDRKIIDHEKVKVFKAEEKLTNIGHIKNKAFNLGTGDILVELDHDDLITHDCLEKLEVAFQDEEIGFVYSDSAMLHMTEEFQPFSESFGWSHRKFTWKGKELYAMRSFLPTSHSLCYIWYAPDHVRAWRTSVYKELGGHNKDLYICDDHELCIRTYLHTKMKYIPEVLYIYRITGDNTWIERNQEIQIKTVELGHQYAQQLAEKDAEFQGLLKVDIGGGINPYPGYVTVDSREGSDYVCDLNNGIPLPDNSVGVLNASHIIEHLKDPIKTMSEIHRVLAHGGWAFIEVPSTDGRGAFQDPTHVSFWNENSFLYYTDAYLANFIDNTDIRFQQYRKETWFPNEWMKSLNVCVTTVWLVAIKQETPRFPGELKI